MNANMESVDGVRDKVSNAAARTTRIARKAGRMVAAHASQVARGLPGRLRAMEPTARSLTARVMKASSTRSGNVDRVLDATRGLARRVSSWTVAARSAVNELRARGGEDADRPAGQADEGEADNRQRK